MTNGNRRFAPVAIATALAVLALLASGARPCSAQTEKAKSLEWNKKQIARIAPVPATGTLTFIFISDLHIPFDDKGAVSTITKKANEIKPAFVLTGGDNVQVGNTANFGAMKNAFAKFKVPIIAAMGNHDTAFEDYNNQVEWKKRFGDDYFYFDAGPARFIFLNNAAFDMPEEAFVFLENAVKTDLKKFVIMHRPPDYLNPKYYKTPLHNSERFRSIVEAGKVTAVMMGHEHHYGYYEVGGVKYIVSGGAGGAVGDDIGNNYHHFILGHVSPAGFEFEVVKI